MVLALDLEVWPWPKIQVQNLGRLQNSPLTSIDWSMDHARYVIKIRIYILYFVFEIHLKM